MTSKKVVIIGSGLFGSIAASLARNRGHDVLVIDNKQPMAASKASGCVLAPSWLSSLPKDEVIRGMKVLQYLYTVHEVEFKTNLMKTFKAQRVDPHEVIVDPDVVASVDQVKSDGTVVLNDGTKHKGLVLVAAGIWSGELVDMPEIRGLYGCSMRFRVAIPHPKIHVYAPYRQAVAFQLGREVWFGDGTALIAKTWHAQASERVEDTKTRARNLMGLKGNPTINIGARPYVMGNKSGYFAKTGDKVWVSTGGAKNGTLLAAAQAIRFIEEAKL
jgi:glycine/D-amino acid oxidase-like deaminating enzyme